MEKQPTIPHRFKIFSRLDKGEAIVQGLQSVGWESVRSWRRGSFVLADHDQKGELLQMKRENKPFFLYPHSARSMILWDGILPQTSYVRTNFVFAPGQRELMRRYGYKGAIDVMGWTYCPILPFQPSREVKRVLFAAIHPNGAADKQGRRLMQIDRQLNQDVMNALLRLGLDITVRYAHDLEDNGLNHIHGVQYQTASLRIESALEAMQGFDVIIAHQTFAYLAIASGKPTVMFGEEVTPHAMQTPVQHWQDYKSLLMFPLDILQGDPMAVLQQAACSDVVIQQWKHNFIGEPFGSDKFLKMVENYL